MRRVLAIGGGLLGVVIAIALIAWLVLGGGSSSSPQVETQLRARDLAERVTLEARARQALQVYEVEHGTLPEDLAAVEDLPALPAGWVWQYDPEAGAITIVAEEE
jgi:hypothetical protein